ncbi:MAG TPA: hypothetical protein VG897_03980 [Terriglobales bacterium]|nr:hypothetical protein [Terriglobales bacterium]
MVRPRTLVLGSRFATRVSGKFAVIIFVLLMSAAALHAGDLRIPIPKRSKYTPVQALNRDGVKAVEHHQYDKAKKLFYKAYLIDPNDPFTLNNLGYMAEIEGDSDRARRFYALSAELGSDAIIDKSSNDELIGKPVASVAGQAEDKGIKINRLNNEAIALLEKDRAPEADLVLQKALTVDPQNPFTLNNLGYTKEKEGEIQAAYQFYTAAAGRNSDAKVEVAIDKNWRGHAISDVARDNARKLNKLMQNVDDRESQVALLNLRGVSALNRNDRSTGREFIQKAFKLAPEDAFTLNNMGYLAEMDGDRETADFYYERAREANQNGTRVAIATRKEFEGKKIGDVADVTDQLVEQQMEDARLARQRQGGPVMLMRRDKTAVLEPPKPVHEPTPQRVSNENGELILPPPPPTTMSNTPVYRQPAGQPNGGPLQPLPDNEQPTTVKEGEHNGGMIMPLPDDQQPGAKPQSQQSQPAPQTQSAPAIAAPPTATHTIITTPAEPAPSNSAPANAPQPATPAPSQQQAPQQTPLLLPPPDKAQSAQPNPAPPKHISDTDSSGKKKQTHPSSTSTPNHISDQEQ